jgi:hypothetical protein
MQSRWAILVAALFASVSSPAFAQQRTVTIELTPTIRTQLAIWIESSDGMRFQTLQLTDSVAFRGIGNRPGAQQMDSGYHWPYGRREGVLPIWAHRRFEATGVAWRRVIFADRPEGYASRAGDEDYNTPDPFFCLSFTGHETVDAVSCASVFRSNKGRFITDTDVAMHYAEPFEDAPGVGRMLVLTSESLYPPRGDYTPIPLCAGCSDHHHDHEDLAAFHDERLRVMPELDTVTMATPPRDMPFSYTWDVPDSWPDGDYVVFVEASTEFDFADPDWRRLSPSTPGGAWDCYAIGTCGQYGRGYRGQPSVLYRVPMAIGAAMGDGMYTTDEPEGHGELHGLTGDVVMMSGSGMVDDPTGHPGSGADRLRAGADGVRVRVTVPVLDPCQTSHPPAECGMACHGGSECAMPLMCGPDGTCVGRCTIEMHPDAPTDLVAAPVTEQSHSHEWAHVSFVAPEVPRGLVSYEVRVGTRPITDEASFLAARPASAATIEDQALTVPTTAAPGETVEFDLGHLSPTETFYIGVRTFDECHAPGQIASTSVTTTVIHFTTVSPCFVATAAFGSPLDSRIGVLRRARDRYLMSNEPGRALVAAYYEVGPKAAGWIAESEERRAAVRAILEPIVSLFE